jgi:hypothetical protein
MLIVVARLNVPAIHANPIPCLVVVAIAKKLNNSVTVATPV